MNETVLIVLESARVTQLKNVERLARYVRYFTKRGMGEYSFSKESREKMEEQERILRQIEYSIELFKKWPVIVPETIGYIEARRIKEASSC